MADNVVANPGAGGDTLAFDDIGGVKYARSKIVLGADGVNGGDVSSANPLPIGDAGGSLTVDGTVALGAGAASIGVLGANSGVDIGDVTVNNAAGAAAVNIQDGGNSITVDGTVTASNTAGVAAHDAAVSGNPVLAAGRSSAAAPTDVSADGDVVTAWRLRNGAAATVLTAAGALIGGDAANGLDVDVTRLPALAAGTNNIGDVDVLTLPALPAGSNLIGSATAVGAAAHDAAVSGNPVLNGYEARTTDLTAVASGDATRGVADTLGKQIILLGAAHDQHVQGKGTFTNTTAADVIAAAGANRRIVVTSILVTNAQASVGTKVEIRDGTTVKVQAYAAPAGGGFMLNAGGAPLFIGTTNTAITARNVTTGADVDVTISGYTIGN